MQWVQLDGSIGEGGGQILRTALSLSALTGRPFVIRNIRAGRKNPGLRPQHLTAVRAVQQICSATVTGATVNSTDLRFEPGPIRSGDYLFDISAEQTSAGSIALVWQTVFPILLFADAPSTVGFLRGGTCVPFSPPIPYISKVFLPMVEKMGVRTTLEMRRAGWYPRGGGQVFSRIQPVSDPLRPILWTDRGDCDEIEVLSLYSRLPPSVGQRQANRAFQRLKEKGMSTKTIKVLVQEEPADSPGTCLLIVCHFPAGRAGFSSLGAPGKPAETVADEAVESFAEYWHRDAPVEKHLADQLLLFMALAEGTSKITVSHLTSHSETNIQVIQAFIGERCRVVGERDQAATIEVSGISLLSQNRRRKEQTHQ
ncbi:MAG: RNA 3'-terminal phosphate cyclase [Armatimonadetes bacterium]|nr:RNA 3'-terminal phosphate cyclase [Armatimonadota bacterium]MDW8121601.1 RNA 3'-terminal phosphate cyclase [Armatimonadota bacterium]